MNHNHYDIIPLEAFAGKKYFKWFDSYDIPNYGLTVEMDITAFYHYLKAHQYPFYFSMIYLVTKALNTFKEFRYRIVDGDIALFDKIDPSFTIMTDRGLYDNVNDVKIDGDFLTYLKEARKISDVIKTGVNLDAECFDDCVDQYYFTCVPWISFQSMSQPMTKNPSIYVPRIAWDKIIEKEGRFSIHMNIVVHHAFVDGYPCAQAFVKIQDDLNHPADILK